MQKELSSPLILALFACFFLAILVFTTTLMAGLYIVGELGGSPEIAAYNVTFYGFGNAIGIPLGKYLPNRIGVSRTLWGALFLFAVTCPLCAIAPNYPIFVFVHFLQGIFLGPLFILINFLFRVLLPFEKQPKVTSINMILFSVVPAIGACWGGWFAYDFHWSWIFYIHFLFSLSLAFFIKMELKDEKIPLSSNPKTPFDGIGYMFYVLSILGVGSALTLGQELDWFRSNLFILLLIIGFGSVIFFIGWSLLHPFPIIQLNLLNYPLFSFGIINLMILFSIYFGTIILLALWLHLDANYTPRWIAVILGIMAIVCLIPSILMRKEEEYIDVRIPLVLSLFFLVFSTFYATHFDVEIDLYHLAISRILAGLGLVLFLPSVFRICFHIVPEENVYEVINFFQIVRVMSSSLGVALYTTLYQRRAVFYHDRLGGQLTHFSQLTAQFFDRASLFDLKGLPAFAQLERSLQRQSDSLALADCFYFMGWLLVGMSILMIFTFFFRKTEKGIEKRVLKFFITLK